jgi:hypothetical protein
MAGEVSAHLNWLILAMLAKDVSNRPSSRQVEWELSEIVLDCEKAKNAATFSHREFGHRRFWLATLIASLVFAPSWFVLGKRDSPQSSTASLSFTRQKVF